MVSNLLYYSRYITYNHDMDINLISLTGSFTLTAAGFNSNDKEGLCV